MDFVIDTGDSADSQQLNETEWVRTLLEGGALDPGSGVDPATSSDPFCAALDAPLIADAATPAQLHRRPGLRRLRRGPGAAVLRPGRRPRAPSPTGPQYPGLLDRAQQPFEAAGLDVPSYVAFGNHDALVQGNAAANAAYETVATGCVKPMSPVGDRPGHARRRARQRSTPADLQSLLVGTDPTRSALVPPDPKRQFVSQAAVQGRSSGRHAGRRPRLRPSSTRPRRPPRAAPPATTRGARSPASASSRSTRSPRPG